MSKARELANLGNAYSDGALSNRNRVINGGFDVWQRGTPTTSASGGSYFSADRWKGYAGSTRTFTRDETSALSIGFKNCIKAEMGTANASFYQRIEDVRTLAGKTVTLSYYIKADTAHTPTATYLTQNFGSGGSSDVNVNLPAPTITTDWQRVEQTVTLPSVEGKTIGTSSYLFVYPFTMTANRTYYITGVQLEVGDTATPFEHRSYGDELQRCQRYYHRVQGNASDQTELGMGYAFGTASVVISYTYPTTMRSPPTISESGVECLTAGVSFTDASLNATVDSSIHKVAIFFGADAGAPFTANRVCRGRLVNDATAFLAFDAEL